MADEYHSFSENAVREATDAARRLHEDVLKSADSPIHPHVTGEFSALAECISVTVSDHRVCLNLPSPFGSICIPIPVNVPDGTAAEACLHICHFGPIPTGVRITISALGKTIVSKVVGKC